jgi:N-acetylmuramoyl-L-alanine amidase
MNVINHWLNAAVKLPYPEGPSMSIRRAAVVHFTAGATAKSSVDFWRTPAAKGAEAHVIIDRDGTVYQIRAFNQKADHAGKSRWIDPNTGKKYFGMNSHSIGIELANGGDSESLIKRYSKLPPVVAHHPNGGSVRKWEAFPEEQICALIDVLLAVKTQYNLDDITGHDFIAPERKNDPGPAFPWHRVRNACGFGQTKPKTHWA